MNSRTKRKTSVLVLFLFFFFLNVTLKRSCSAATFADADNTNHSLRHNDTSDVISDANYYRLEEKLLKNYRPHLRPVRSHRTVTNVSLYIYLLALLEVNEAYQTLRHSSWLSMTWVDEFLTWNPDDYDGLDKIEVPERMIWTPTVSISNSASGDVFLQDPTAMFARVTADGTVVWVPIGVKETLCSLDITFYPFDTQICSVVLGMWSSPEVEVNLTVLSTQLDPAYYVENSEWKLTGAREESHPYTFKGQLYSKYHVFFHLKRRRLFHCLTLIVPNVLLALLAGFVFALPQDCGEKMSFSMSLLLAFAVNLSVLVSAMPRSSLHVSLLMIYLTSLSIVTALSVVATVCLLRLYHKVGVVGPKVTAFTLLLRRRCGCGKPTDVRDDALTHYDDNNCHISSVLNQNDIRESDVLRSDLISSDTKNAPVHSNGKPHTNPHKLTDKLLASEPQRNPSLTWKDVAATLDCLCFRGFVVVIVGMTSTLVVLLFKGQ